MVNYDTIEYIKQLISELLERADIKARVEYEDSLSRGLVFNIRSLDSRLLIGQKGVTLQALEHVVHAIVSRKLAGTEEQVRFSVDVDEYKRKREWSIKQMLKEQVQKIKTTGEPVLLPQMSKYERKFVHTYIQEQFPHITSESFGEEPDRRIKLSL